MSLPLIGFVGLGEMGRPLVRNLLRAGHPILAFDLNTERLAAAVTDGASAVNSAAAVAAAADVVLTSLPSSDAFVQVAEADLLPHARTGQTFIDLGTVTPPETRRLAAAFAARGATLLDAPVSGGPRGAETGTLLMFVGGDPTAVERCRPLLEVFSGRITHCGPAGMGQVVKGVNQLAMGLGAAAYLEAVAFGVRAGADAAVLQQALEGPEPWRKQLAQTAARAAAGQGSEIGVKFRELPYYLREAEEQGFKLPLTQILYGFLEHAERVVIDDHRPAPSFWHELMARSESVLPDNGTP